MSSLIKAILQRNNVEALQLIANNVIDDNALILACSRGLKLTDVALALIAANADINHSDDNKNTPLLFACSNDLTNVALALINAGADVNHVNKYGDFPLLITSKLNSIEITSALIEAKANVDQIASNGDSALIEACRYGLINIAFQLINAGANLNHKNDYEESPLYAACNINSIEMVSMLINAGCAYQFCETEKIDMQKVFSFNFAEYPIRHEFTLNDMRLLSKQKRDQVQTLLLLGTRGFFLANELIQLISREMFV